MSAKEQLPTSLKVFYRGIKTPTLRKDFIEIFYYIKKVSDDFDVSISDVEFMNIFGIDPERLPSKMEINKKLFEIAKTKEVKNRIVADFNPDVVDIATNSFFFQNNSRDLLLRSISETQTRIRDYYNEIKSSVKSMFNYQKELKQLDSLDSSDVFVREMNKIISSNKFEQVYFYMKPATICAVTSPVTLKYAEIDYNFGQYIIAFDCSQKNFNVYPYKNNITIENAKNRYHPHVFDSRNICWGNAGAAFSELISSLKIGDLFLIADMILHSYNHDSPVNVISDYGTDPQKLTKDIFTTSRERLADMPIHLQTIIDWYPRMDDYVYESYKLKYRDIYNFKYERFPEEPAKEEDVFDKSTIVEEVVSAPQITISEDNSTNVDLFDHVSETFGTFSSPNSEIVTISTENSEAA